MGWASLWTSISQSLKHPSLCCEILLQGYTRWEPLTQRVFGESWHTCIHASGCFLHGYYFSNGQKFSPRRTPHRQQLCLADLWNLMLSKWCMRGRTKYAARTMFYNVASNDECRVLQSLWKNVKGKFIEVPKKFLKNLYIVFSQTHLFIRRPFVKRNCIWLQYKQSPSKIYFWSWGYHASTFLSKLWEKVEYLGRIMASQVFENSRAAGRQNMRPV